MQRNATPGLEVSLGQLPEHRFLQLGFCQKLFEAGVLLLQLGQPLGLLGLHAPRTAVSSGVGRLGQLDGPADLDDGLALGDQLLSSTASQKPSARACG